jgi:hypothetical protein
MRPKGEGVEQRGIQPIAHGRTMMLEQTIVMLCMILRQTSEKARQDIPLLPGLLA